MSFKWTVLHYNRKNELRISQIPESYMATIKVIAVLQKALVTFFHQFTNFMSILHIELLH